MSDEIWVGIAVILGGGIAWAAAKTVWTRGIVPYIFHPIGRNLGEVISDRIHERDQQFFTELLDARLAPIRRELQLNGGNSLKDIVVNLRGQFKKIHRQQHESAKSTERIEMSVDELDNQMRRIREEALMDREGIWEALAEHGIDRRGGRQENN